MKCPAPVIEILEARIAPATLVLSANHKSGTFTDVDGDHVTVTVSVGDLANAVVTVPDVGGSFGAQLQSITLNSGFSGANVSITAVRTATGGDGYVNVGQIVAPGVDLGTVKVDGDLGHLEAGSGGIKAAVKALTVGSLGRFGTATGAGSLTSQVIGNLGAVTVVSDFVGVTLQSLGANAGIGIVTIGGDLTADVNGVRGQLFCDADIGLVKIGGDLRAGPSDESGKIVAKGKLAGVTIGGTVYGGSDGTPDTEQQISSVGDLGPVKIGGDLRGGGAAQSGGIQSVAGSIASITIGGSIIPGAGAASGSILAQKSIGAVKIGGSFTSGSATDSGTISSNTGIKSIYIGGSMIGGTGNFDVNELHSGQIRSLGPIGSVTIRGSIIGGTGSGTGSILSGPGIGSITVDGSVLAGTGGDSAFFTGSKIGAIKIGGDLSGRAADTSGSIFAGTLDSLSVGGSVIGSLIAGGETIGSVKIAGSLLGLSNSVRAQIIGSAFGGQDVVIKSVTVGGDVKFADIAAGYTVGFVVASADKQIGSIKVGGDWIQSNAVASVDPKAGGFGNADDTNSTLMNNDPLKISKIASIVIGGQVIGTAGGADSYGFVAQQIGSFKVGKATVALAAGKNNDVHLIGSTLDVTVREIP